MISGKTTEHHGLNSGRLNIITVYFFSHPDKKLHGAKSGDLGINLHHKSLTPAQLIDLQAKCVQVVLKSYMDSRRHSIL